MPEIRSELRTDKPGVLTIYIDNRSALNALTTQMQIDLIEALRTEWIGIADEVATFVQKHLPTHLLSEYRHANELALLPLFNKLAETLIARGLLTPPENQLGAEGCWMIVKQ